MLRALVRVALAALVLTFALPAVAFAEPQTATPTNAPVGIHLVYQSPWVGLHDKYSMVLHVDDPSLVSRSDSAVAVRVYESATSRSAFDQAVSAKQLGGVVATATPMPVESIGRLGTDLALSLALPGADVPPGTPTISITKAGVYPVEVSLTNTGTPTGSFVTWLVVVDTSSPTPINKPLLMSWIVPVVADPATMPDGSIDPGVSAQMRRGGRLDRLATVLDRAANPPDGRPRLPVSVTAGPETMETWAKLSRTDSATTGGFERLRDAAQRDSTNLLPTSYVPVDGPAFEAAGLGTNLPQQFVEGGKALHDALGVSPFDRARTTFVDPADDASVDRLRQMLLTRVAVREASLVPVNHQFTPAQGFDLVTQGGRSDGLATAPFLEQLIDGPDAPALKAARVIAAISEVAYELPGRQRGVVIAPPARWDPDVTAVSAVFDALRDLPLVQPVTLDDMFNKISTEQVRGADVERHLQPPSSGPTPITPAEYTNATALLRAYEGVAGVDDPAAVAGERTLLVSLSTSITRERALAGLAQIRKTVTSFTHAVKVDAKRITLTAKRASVPLTFENNLRPARPIRVRVHFDSQKLLFPQGESQVVTLQPGTTPLRFDVEARASGTFPMRITLTSEDGRLSFGSPVRVTVRSAVFGSAALGVTIAALVFLAAWWGNHFRRSRRERRQATLAVT